MGWTFAPSAHIGLSPNSLQFSQGFDSRAVDKSAATLAVPAIYDTLPLIALGLSLLEKCGFNIN